MKLNSTGTKHLLMGRLSTVDDCGILSTQFTFLDVYFPETVLLVREVGGGLIIGDMLSGGRQDAGIADGDLGIYAPEYIADLEKARSSISQLLNYSYNFICFGHGTPIFDDPKAKLKRYVESDEIGRTWREESKTHHLPLKACL